MKSLAQVTETWKQTVTACQHMIDGTATDEECEYIFGRWPELRNASTAELLAITSGVRRV